MYHSLFDNGILIKLSSLPYFADENSNIDIGAI